MAEGDLSSPRFLAMVAAETARIEALSPEERAAQHRAWQESIAEPQTTGYNGPTVPERFMKSRLSNYRPANDSQKTALEVATKAVMRIAGGQAPRIAIIGNEGAGKSHLLHAIQWALWEQHGVGMGVVAGTWPDIANDLRYGRVEAMADGTSREVPAAQMRARLYRAKIIFIDDVTPTAATDFDGTELKNLLIHAYNHRIAMVVTSNVSPLAKVMGGPAADRFEQLIVVGPTRQERFL